MEKSSTECSKNDSGEYFMPRLPNTTLRRKLPIPQPTSWHAILPNFMYMP